MKTRRKFGFFLITLTLALLVTIASTAIPRTTSDRYDRTQRGWPLAFQHTIDTRGDCISFLDELPSDGSCRVRRFPVSYTNLAINFVLYAVAIGAVGGTIRSVSRRKN